MRKRKVRTLLVLITVVIVTFSMISLTSVIPARAIARATGLDTRASYDGILLKRQTTTAPDNVIDRRLIEFVSSLIGGDVPIAPRAWLYPASSEARTVVGTLTLAGSSFNVRGVLGLSTYEPNATGIGDVVEGLWFMPEDYEACILSKEAATSLNAKMGDRVSFGPLILLVRGIVDSTPLNSFRDLDNQQITPVDPLLVNQLLEGQGPQEQRRVPLAWNEVLIIPYKLAMDLGGYTASIAVGIDDEAALNKVAGDLALSIEGINIYACHGASVYSATPILAFDVEGWAYIVLPLIVAGFTILNTILAEVLERQREIAVYTSLGLTPRGVSTIFFTEAVVYALTAAVIGYLLGIVVNIILVSQRLLPPNFIINASSITTLLSLLVSMVAIVAASAYPALLASRRAVPSLERKWRLATKPMGDEWTVPLPFSTVDTVEVSGIMKYLAEYFASHTSETPEPFIVKEYRVEKDMLYAMMLLQPVEAGTAQEVFITAPRSETGLRYFFSIMLKRVTGPPEVWTSANYGFIDLLRKQFLIWRGLSEEERSKYLR